ncbi:MAG: UDP-N-acetylmuramoyl-L-alanine--D-glutamate ligase [Patescibacteria group bacterium]
MQLDLKNKKVLVMGLGLNGGGLSVTKWLVKRGAKVTVTDLKTRFQLKKSLDQLRGLSIKYVLGQHHLADFKNTDLIIKNPGVPNSSIYLKTAIKNKIPIEGDISLFFLQNPAPIIGITGTRGKSTVTKLLGEIFAAAKKRPVVAGNIGVSPLDYLAKITEKNSVILELSSWQLEILAKHHLSPRLAIVTNIFPDHLNRYSSMNSYVAAKTIIFKSQAPTDVVIFNRDNKWTKAMGKTALAQRYWFSKKKFVAENGSFLQGSWIYFRQNGKVARIVNLKNIKLQGEHNWENVLAAVTAALVWGIKPVVIQRVLAQFAGVAERQELVREVGGIKFYDDTTATIPEATISALKTLGGRKQNVILIAGGADKKLKFKDLAREIKKRVKLVILLKGTATPKIKKELLKINYWSTVTTDNMVKAVESAFKVARPGDIILLSPACASFGLFINEFDRGRQFQVEVKKVTSSK